MLAGQTICSRPFWYCTKAVGVMTFCTPSNLTLPLIVSKVSLAMVARIFYMSRTFLATAVSRISSDIQASAELRKSGSSPNFFT